MASVTLSNAVYYQNTTAGVSEVVGYESGTKRAVRYTMTAPKEGANRVSLTFAGFSLGGGAYPSLKFCVTTNSDTYETSESSTGSLALSSDKKTYSGSASITLLPNVEYYVWIFPGTTTYGYLWWQTLFVTSTFTTSGSARSIIIDKTSGVLGEQYIINVTQYIEGSTYDITYACGTMTGVIVIGESADQVLGWVPDISLATQNLSGPTVSVSMMIQTYYNGSSVGEPSTITVTMVIPENEYTKPACRLDLTDIATLPDGESVGGAYDALVQGLSSLQAVVVPTIPTYGAPIETYRTTVSNMSGVTFSDPEFSIGTLKTAGTIIITTTVTDARGIISDPYVIELEVIEYKVPAITSLSVNRCKSDGTLDDQGEYALVTFSAHITPLNGLNSAKYMLYYKTASESDYVSTEIDALAGVYSVNDYTYICPDGSYSFEADGGHTYNVMIVAEDNHYGDTESGLIGTSFTLLHFNASGTGIGMGKISEKENAVELGIPMYDYSNSYFQEGLIMSSARGESTEGVDVIGNAADNVITWKYRKWSNGDVDLWGVYQVSNIACTASLGSMYRTKEIWIPRFPFPVYHPHVTASYETDGHGAFLWATNPTLGHDVGIKINDIEYKAVNGGPPSYYLVRPVSSTGIYGQITFYVKGRLET